MNPIATVRQELQDVEGQINKIADKVQAAYRARCADRFHPNEYRNMSEKAFHEMVAKWRYDLEGLWNQKRTLMGRLHPSPSDSVRDWI